MRQPHVQGHHRREMAWAKSTKKKRYMSAMLARVAVSQTNFLAEILKRIPDLTASSIVTLVKVVWFSE